MESRYDLGYISHRNLYKRDAFLKKTTIGLVSVDLCDFSASIAKLNHLTASEMTKREVFLLAGSVSTMDLQLK